MQEQQPYLVIEEATSPACRRLVRDKAGMVVWVLTRTEMTSAILSRIGTLADRWTEITDVDLVRDRPSGSSRKISSELRTCFSSPQRWS